MAIATVFKNHEYIAHSIPLLLYIVRKFHCFWW